jgi:hypothetical protein
MRHGARAFHRALWLVLPLTTAVPTTAGAIDLHAPRINIPVNNIPHNVPNNPIVPAHPIITSHIKNETVPRITSPPPSGTGGLPAAPVNPGAAQPGGFTEQPATSPSFHQSTVATSTRGQGNAGAGQGTYSLSSADSKTQGLSTNPGASCSRHSAGRGCR